MPEFRYRIRPGHKHFSGRRRYSPGDEIAFPRSMMESDIRHKLEPLDELAERAVQVADLVNTLRIAETEGGYNLLGLDGRRINTAPLSKADAEAVLAATTAPAEPADEGGNMSGDQNPGADFKRPYRLEKAGVGFKVLDAEGRKVHEKRSVSKADAEELLSGNEPAEE